MSLDEQKALIVAQGEVVRKAKADKVAPEVLQQALNELLKLKETFKEMNGGVPYDPPKVEVKKEKKVEPQVEVVRDGPSKKELNKLKRKEGKKGGGNDDDNTEVVEQQKTAAFATTQAQNNAPVAVKKNVASAPGGVYYSFSNKLSALPEISRLLLAYLKSTIKCVSSTSSDHLPYFVVSDGVSVAGDCTIARYFARTIDNGSKLYGTDAIVASQIDQWLDVYNTVDIAAIPAVLKVVNDHLSDKTYMAGQSLSLADFAVHVLIKRSTVTNDLVHILRWQALVGGVIPALDALKPGKASAPSAASANKQSNDDEFGGTCPHLEGAEDGKVCTRFPPEPSGYLHIGHAKAVLLNQYYARRYKGKLLVRFDDTNPSKEKDEYEQNIIIDLASLGVVADQVSHTSDHFGKCEELARKMIKEGNAYMDDTPQEKMQEERGSRTESYRRNSTVEDNLAKFEALLKGAKEAQTFCLRAKIDMSSVNGTMRDPVLYRFNDTPHHQTGTKYKAYPTYDFACPIVDAIEGVTHALRTTEYNDRDEQYHWIQKALGLRYVYIHSFGKMNFQYTVLSKRKLNWFVENKLVEGWFDPRFPTVQGCVRRGMNVEALKRFILSQGASRRVVNMEWDKFWSDNKKVLEESATRYMGVSQSNVVTVTLTNVSEEITCETVLNHPKKPELGTRVLRFYKEVLLELVDAEQFAEGEEVTLLHWGNFTVTKIVKNSDNKVTAMSAKFNPDSKDFKKTKKTHWIPAIPDLVSCRLNEYDYLITKDKIDEDESFENFVNPVSLRTSMALCDPCLRNLAFGEIIQLERKGFYRCDQIYQGSDKPCVLILIPDGKLKK